MLIIYKIETQEMSMLLITNLKVDSIKKKLRYRFYNDQFK